MERRVDLRKIIDLSKFKLPELMKLLRGTTNKGTRKVISKHVGFRHTVHAYTVEHHKRRNRNRRRNKIARQSRRINQR